MNRLRTFHNGMKKRLNKVKFPYDKKLPMKGWMVQGKNEQVVFWEAKSALSSPPHTHPYPEWGIVLNGWAKIIINGKSGIYKKGDQFYVKANAKHAAETSPNYQSFDVFFSPNHIKEI